MLLIAAGLSAITGSIAGVGSTRKVSAVRSVGRLLF